MKSHAATLDVHLAKATSRARMLVLLGAFVSFLMSVSLWFTGAREQGMFVGLWVPSILALGAVLLPPKR